MYTPLVCISINLFGPIPYTTQYRIVAPGSFAAAAAAASATLWARQKGSSLLFEQYGACSVSTTFHGFSVTEETANVLVNVCIQSASRGRDVWSCLGNNYH